MWISHPSFPRVVRDAEENPSSMLHVVTKFTDKAKNWNRNVFGNLFHRKNQILARLKGVQIGLSNRPNKFLVHIETELRAKLAKVSALEEVYWAMKSHITWLVKGDKNTTFYHTFTLVRRNRNRISCLKDHLGNWINDERKIADFIRNGYSELFMSSHSSSTLLP